MVENEDLMNILSQINQWINNCDTKASILLALIGILVGVIFSNKYNYKLVSIYYLNPLPPSWQLIIYSIFLIISVIMILLGILNFLKIICPKFNVDSSNKDSLIFYASISENSLKEYENKIKSAEYSFREDLISQIHINASICTEKFENYKQGLKLTITGFILITVLILLRYTLYTI